MALSQIALVGLGAMGLPMATNLVAAGFAVRGYDLRPESRGAFAAAGGAAADTPAAAASGGVPGGVSGAASWSLRCASKGSRCTCKGS